VGRKARALLTAASLAVTGCGNDDPMISDAPVPQPTLTPEQARAIGDAVLRVDETDTTFCLTAVSDALDLDISDMCLRVPFAAVELMYVSGPPRGLVDERYSAVSLWIMPLAEAVVDVEGAEGQVDPIFRGSSGALMIISEAVSNVTPMTLVVVYGGSTLRCRLTHGSNNCLSE
jgi:hypothetical protein